MQTEIVLLGPVFNNLLSSRRGDLRLRYINPSGCDVKQFFKTVGLLV